MNNRKGTSNKGVSVCVCGLIHSLRWCLCLANRTALDGTDLQLRGPFPMGIVRYTDRMKPVGTTSNMREKLESLTII
jgi:hypothetical protein